jgi:hypothetical protein
VRVLAILVALALGTVAPARPAGPGDCIVLEDFSRARVGEFPAEWKARSDEGRHVYTVREDGGRRLLRAVSSGLGIQAGRDTLQRCVG